MSPPSNSRPAGAADPASLTPSGGGGGGGVPEWHPGLAVAAWLVPGLGHLLLGERRRGAIIGLSIGALWLAGVLIGGISVVHLREGGDQFLKYFQRLTAPSLLVGAYHESLKDPRTREAPPPPVEPGQPVPYEPSFGHVNEIGVLYTALAGLLNLLAMIDVVYRDPVTRARRAAGVSVELTPETSREAAR